MRHRRNGRRAGRGDRGGRLAEALGLLNQIHGLLVGPVSLAFVVPHHIEGVDPLFAQGGIILDVFAHPRDDDGKLVVLVPQLSMRRLRRLSSPRLRVAPTIVLCYQAGYDAFWLARFLKGRGVECLVVDSANMQVNRRARRAKTDHIDVGKLLRGLIAWLRGDRHVWSVVRIPSVDEEDLRRSHRERDYLVHERTAHINRIKGLLFAQGIRGINVKRQYKTLHVDKLDWGWSSYTAASCK